MLRLTLLALSGLAVLASCASIAACHAPFDGGDSKEPGDLATLADPTSDAGDGGDAAPRALCPDGLGARWVCDGTARRVRCVDDHLVEQACASGCTLGMEGEAVCSCGDQTTMRRWSCGESGIATCAGGDAWIEDSCGGRACITNDKGSADCPNDASFQNRIAELGASCGSIAPGVKCSIAVHDFDANVHAGHEQTVPFVSASAAKPFWVAAALFDTRIDAVQPYAQAIFAQSDNIATGHVLDLLSWPDRVNTFLWQDVQVADIGFCSWNYGGTRNATNCPNVMGSDNFLTTSDSVRFLGKLWDRSLLGETKTKALLDWMKLSPRQGYGGWLGTQLPATARTTMYHKAGWRPPNAIPGYSNANEIGIVSVPGGHTYAVAFALSGAPSQAAYDNQELPLLEYLSCGVYHAVAGDDASSCTHP